MGIDSTVIQQANPFGSKIDVSDLAATFELPASNLAADAVETAKIKDDNVTTAKIAAANITETELATAVVPGFNKISDQEIGTAVQTVAFSSLTGNTADTYLLRGVVKSGAASNQIYLRLNADAGTNYGRLYIKTDGTTVTTGLNASGAVSNLMIFGDSVADGAYVTFEATIQAKSGIPRTATGFGGVAGSHFFLSTGQWNNTADEITSISVVAAQADGIDPTSRLVLWGKRA